jgi:hypothetical protein
MRIAFICGTLEPGCDGVGDYTRGLAAELRLQEHEACVIAITDKFANETVETEQAADPGAAPVLRLPASRSWQDRIARAEEYLNDFQPDWVSLQFVPFTFQPKGVVYGLWRKLRPLLGGRKMEVMFHEIWIGEELGFGWKRRGIGIVQKYFILKFIRDSKPAVIHTSNEAYRSILASHGVSAQLLPLFGSVPVSGTRDTKWIEDELLKTAGSEYRREAFWIFGIFGALATIWPPEPLLSTIARAAKAAGKRVAIVSIGRIGLGLQLWEKISRDYSDQFVFLLLGEQPSDRIADFLAYIDRGVATTPLAVIGKSATAASMMEHGVPVIVNRDDVRYRVSVKQEHDPLLIPYDAGFEQKLLRGPVRRAPESRRPRIAARFIDDLEQSKGAERVTTDAALS